MRDFWNSANKIAIIITIITGITGILIFPTDSVSTNSQKINESTNTEYKNNDQVIVNNGGTININDAMKHRESEQEKVAHEIDSPTNNNTIEKEEVYLTQKKIIEDLVYGYVLNSNEDFNKLYDKLDLYTDYPFVNEYKSAVLGERIIEGTLQKNLFWLPRALDTRKLYFDFNNDGKDDEIRVTTQPPIHYLDFSVKINGSRYHLPGVQGLDEDGSYNRSMLVQISLFNIIGNTTPELLIAIRTFDQSYLHIFEYHSNNDENPFELKAVLDGQYYFVLFEDGYVCKRVGSYGYDTYRWNSEKFHVINSKFLDWADPQYDLSPDINATQ